MCESDNVHAYWGESVLQPLEPNETGLPSDPSDLVSEESKARLAVGLAELAANRRRVAMYPGRYLLPEATDNR